MHMPGCRYLRGCHPVETSLDDERPLCKACFPTCVVCMSEPGHPLPSCPHGHSMCLDCMHLHIQAQAEARALDVVMCPCGHGRAIDMRTEVSTRVFRYWVESLMGARTEHADLPPPSVGNVTTFLCAHARCVACPHCDRPFVDFDGCAALQCTCSRHFCALCLCPFSGSRETHHHVAHECAHNSNGTYYVPLELCRRVWAARARARMRQALWEVGRTEGLWVGVAMLWSVWWRDPELLTVFGRGGGFGSTWISVTRRELWSAVSACTMIASTLWWMGRCD